MIRALLNILSARFYRRVWSDAGEPNFVAAIVTMAVPLGGTFLAYVLLSPNELKVADDLRALIASISPLVTVALVVNALLTVTAIVGVSAAITQGPRSTRPSAG